MHATQKLLSYRCEYAVLKSMSKYQNVDEKKHILNKNMY